MKVIAITGASAGIGRATALAFARKGASIGLIARSEKALAEVKSEVEQVGGKAIVISCDVAEDRALENAVEKIENELGLIDVWINCAMVSVFSRFEDIAVEEYRRVTDVTYHGYVLGTMAALRKMKSRNRGHIIQVGSALSYRSIPLQSAYCGAKHAIRGFTNSLRAELIHEKSAVELSIIQFPAFNTPQFSWVGLHMDKQPQPLPPIHDPSLAAEAIIWTVEHPQREIWVGWPTWKAILGNKLFPGLLDRYMAKQAWEGQFTDQDPAPSRKSNLFNSVEGLHNEKGAFTDREVTNKPVLWHVPNQNFWINGAALILIVIAFLLGLMLG